MKPEQFKKYTENLEKELKKLKSSKVKVGLPEEKVGGDVYGNGQSVIEIGAIHEFGTPDIPRRSFLRTPFKVKEKEIFKFIKKQYEDIQEGGDVKQALNLVGVKAQKVSVKAFSNNGYGKWKGLSPATIKQKGSSRPLIASGTLRDSITWVVVDD